MTYEDSANRILIISHIPYYYKKSKLRDFFTIKGTNDAIPEIQVLVDKVTGKSKGFIICTFNYAAEAKKAKDCFTGNVHFGEPLEIKFLAPEHRKNVAYYSFGDTRINRNGHNIRFLNALRPHVLVPLSNKSTNYSNNKIYLEEENIKCLKGIKNMENDESKTKKVKR